MAGLNDVARAVGLKPSQAASLFAAILECCRNGGKVRINGFGTFFLKKRAGHKLFVPFLPGGGAQVPERMVLRFRPSKATREMLAGGIEAEEEKPKKKRAKRSS